jgi:hypothetical protein
MFREREHRQERIGIEMTLWPTGPTRGEEANEIEIGNFNTPSLFTHEFRVGDSGLHVTGGAYRCNLLAPPYTLTRFDATVLTVEPRGNEWAALVLEKLEGDIKDNSGKTSKIYVMGVARDGWGKLNDNQWTLLWSEQLGQQR